MVHGRNDLSAAIIYGSDQGVLSSASTAALFSNGGSRTGPSQ
jgi:hypothetical protein